VIVGGLDLLVGALVGVERFLNEYVCSVAIHVGDIGRLAVGCLLVRLLAKCRLVRYRMEEVVRGYQCLALIPISSRLLQ
jgi:hypothetical protein